MSEIFYGLDEQFVVCLLAFIGGFVDAAGYLRLLGVFTSSITGNLVVACASVTSLHGVLCRALVCISFTGSGAVGAILALRMKRINKLSLPVIVFSLFGLEVLMLIAVCVAGLILDDFMTPSSTLDQWQIIFIACLMGSSMGFHNVASKEAIVNCPPTTVMTSTLINFAVAGSNVVYFYAAKKVFGADDAEVMKEVENKFVENMPKLLVTLRPLLVFLIGAIIGAITMEKGTFWCIVIPVAIVILLMTSVLIKYLKPWETVTQNDRVVDSLKAAEASTSKPSLVQSSSDIKSITWGVNPPRAAETVTEKA